MKKLFLLLFVASTLLITACGRGEDTNGNVDYAPTITPAPAPELAPAPAPTPEPTPAPTPEPELVAIPFTIDGEFMGFAGTVYRDGEYVTSPVAAGTYTITASSYVIMNLYNSDFVERDVLTLRSETSTNAAMADIATEITVTLYDGEFFIFRNVTDIALVTFTPVN